MVEAQTAAFETAKTALIAEIQDKHVEALSNAENEKHEELTKLRDEHQTVLASLRAEFAAQAESTEHQHGTSIRELETSLKSQLDQAAKAQKSALAERDEMWEVRLSDLETQHSNAIASAMQTSDSSAAAKLKEVDEKHTAALNLALEEARIEAETKTSTAQKSHDEALTKALEDAKAAAETELVTMGQSHTQALKLIEAEANKMSADNIAELERKHQESLTAAMIEAKETARRASESAASAHNVELLETRSTLTEQIADLQSQIDHSSEQQRLLEGDLATLHQENLDLTEQYKEAERTADKMRAEFAEQEGHTAGEMKRLQEEFEALNTHLEAVKREREEAEVLMQRSMNDKSQLEKQIAVLKKQVSSMSPIAKRPQSSRGLEPAFKETNTPLRNGSDRPVSRSSTRPGTSHSELPELRRPSSPSVNMATAAAAVAVGRSSAQRPGSSSQRPGSSSQRPGSSSQRQFTPRRPSDNFAYRPSTPRRPSDVFANQPSTPQQSSNAISSREQQPRSFEDYLQNAQTELSELGSVITANETLFAQKIQEHVGDLQRAKDLLSQEYKQKFEALSIERNKREKETVADNAAEFVAQRNALVASFGASNGQLDGHAALPVQQAEALMSAERELVTKYNNRVAKRKSQIQIKHAEQFQSLSQDYDRRVGEVLNQRARLEGDLSVNPDTFEHDFSELDAKSVQLQAEKESVHGSPVALRKPSQQQAAAAAAQPDPTSPPPPTRKTPTYPPRTPTSAPARDRAFFPGSRNSPQATSQPLLRSPRTPNTVNTVRSDGSVSTFPPIRHHSLTRPKSPAAVRSPNTTSGNNVGVPETPEQWFSPPESPADIEQDFGIDAVAFEAGHAASRLRRFAGSPDLRRESAETQRATPTKGARRKGGNGAPLS